MTTRAVVSMLLAWAIPGSGHLYLGRRRRGLAFFAIVVVLFVVGVFIDGSLYTIAGSRGSLLRMLASYASMGSGFLYFLTSRIGAAPGNVVSDTFEYGSTFMLTAGLMNLLLVLDCYDIANDRKVGINARKQPERA
jgi:TM2 domain-containing membrane protein YozV